MATNTSTDRKQYEPEQSYASGRWMWWRSAADDPANLPPDLFDRLKATTGGMNNRSYATREEALADLERTG